MSTTRIMAEGEVNLDDFFAKKDKRKKGKGKKYTTSNSLVKGLEVTQPEPEKKDVKIDISTAPTQDDEWKEEEEQQQDLEGLKIQALKLDSEDSSEKLQPEDECDVVECEADEQVKTKTSQSPWQGISQQTVESTQTKVSEKPSGKYVPPKLRGPTKSSRSPPDIQSARAFPSLHESTQMVQKDSKVQISERDFMEVRSSRGGGMTADNQYEAGPGLELTSNRFSALESHYR